VTQRITHFSLGIFADFGVVVKQKTLQTLNLQGFLSFDTCKSSP